jgi:imidazolonepropionase-like amidohydrolase
MGTLDPEWPTINLREAIESGMARRPRLIVAPHMISATAGHGDMQGMFPCRCHMGLSRVADSLSKIRELVRMEHAFGANWIETMNTGGYMSAGDDPARVTWFEDEMLALGQTAHQLGLPLAVHTGAAEGCKQALRAGDRAGAPHSCPMCAPFSATERFISSSTGNSASVTRANNKNTSK